jgi:Bacteriocin-protection, YdeI or OmpD-Associated
VVRFEQLRAAGCADAAGLAVFDSRALAVSEETPAQLQGDGLAVFQDDPGAWEFFLRQPPGYRRQAAWFVMSARTRATRKRRLLKVIGLSALQKRLPGYG